MEEEGEGSRKIVKFPNLQTVVNGSPQKKTGYFMTSS